ncbi:MAG: YceI family protein [Gemmatimonadales bacterium]
MRRPMLATALVFALIPLAPSDSEHLLHGSEHFVMLPALKCDPASRMTVDLEQSRIRWKGTKFWGLGSHEGTVRLKAGEICVMGGRIAGGTFVADLRTIEVTDIPANDPVPRNRLRNHLLSEDFFHVEAFPEARLVLVAVEQEQRSLHRVRARLTIRSFTHEITFFARIWSLTPDEIRAEARFPVDRHRFGVRYRGSTLRDDLVDDEFTLELTLLARPPERP